jgi:hypothetical protein
LLYSAFHRRSPLSVVPVDFPAQYHFNTLLSSLCLASAAMPVPACRNLSSHRLRVRYLCLCEQWEGVVGNTLLIKMVSLTQCLSRGRMFARELEGWIRGGGEHDQEIYSDNHQGR